MNGTAGFSTTQPTVIITFVLLIVSMLFLRLGKPLMAQWLGLTDRNASRISAAILVGLWALLLLLPTMLGTGNMDLSALGSVGGSLLGRSWWILLLVAVPFVLSRIRK